MVAGPSATDDHVRVLAVGDGWIGDTPGGLNRYFADLHVFGVALGLPWRAIVLGPGAGAPRAVVLVASRGRALPVRLLQLWRTTMRLGRHADVLDIHFALNGLLPALLRRPALPMVVHFQGPWAAESAFGDGRRRRPAIAAKRLVERLTYRRAERIVVLTRAFAAEVVERYGVDPERVVVVPPAVDLDRFVPGDRVAARSHLGLEDVETVVAVRRLVPRMGLEHLIDAWSEVRTRRPSAQLVIAGDGPLRAQLERRVGTNGGVRFLGRVADDDLVELYRAADLTVVPTVGLEGFGLVVLESLATGTPVVATSVSGLPEAVDGLRPALLVPPGSAPALAAQIADVLADPHLAPSPDVCRAHAGRFSPAVLVEAHLAVYRSALAVR